MVRAAKEAFLPGVSFTTRKCRETPTGEPCFELVSVVPIPQQFLSNAMTVGTQAIGMEMKHDSGVAPNTRDRVVQDRFVQPRSSQSSSQEFPRIPSVARRERSDMAQGGELMPRQTQ